jgi:hypothetical protein
MKSRAAMRTAVALAVACLGAALTVAACGAPDITGTYKSTGGGVLSAGTTLTINSDGTFKASGAIPMSNSPFELSGEWTQDGASVTLTPKGTFANLIGVQTGTYEDGKLVFEKETWEKQ